VKTLVRHDGDHDIIAHQYDAAERHAAVAGFITERLLPRVVEGWRHASDAELVVEIRRLASQPDSELTRLLIALATDEQVRRIEAGAVARD
jgi:hypothetical protein